jgi:hypothetical protein
VDRAVWQALAEERILAAQTLLAAKQWASAYYLAGYAVEFGLKSCILVRVASNPKVIFEDKTFSAQCWSHSVDSLVVLAGLEAVRSIDIGVNPSLAKNWLTVRSWNEKSRYHLKTQSDAEELCSAITDSTNGVMTWIIRHW